MSAAPLEQVIAQITDGLQLSILRHNIGGHYSATTTLGEWPRGETISATMFDEGEARVSVYRGEDPELWLDRTVYRLPFAELLKVADFLALDIPLAQPAGSQVPA